MPEEGEVLAIERGPMYRVLGVAAADAPGVFLLHGYEIWPEPLLIRVRPYWWCDGIATPAQPEAP